MGKRCSICGGRQRSGIPHTCTDSPSRREFPQDDGAPRRVILNGGTSGPGFNMRVPLMDIAQAPPPTKEQELSARAMTQEEIGRTFGQGAQNAWPSPGPVRVETAEDRKERIRGEFAMQGDKLLRAMERQLPPDVVRSAKAEHEENLRKRRAKRRRDRLALIVVLSIFAAGAIFLAWWVWGMAQT